MPSTRNRGSRPARTPQTKQAPADQQPEVEAPAPAPTPPPAASDQSLFDDPQDAPPAADPVTDEIAQPGETSVEDRPEGIDGAEGGTPADPTQPEPPAATEGQPEDEAKPEGLISRITHGIASAIGLTSNDDGEPEQQGDSEQSSGKPVTVRLGQAEGLLHRMSLGEAMSFADQFAEKIEVLQSVASVQDLVGRMRASEGRCAPIYFTMNDDGEPEHLLAGDDALAAAKAASITDVSVILINPGDAGAVQAYLNQQASSAAVSTEDDELVWRAHNDAS